MLHTEGMRRIDDMEQAFKGEDDPTYEKGAAMAMMKKIRLSLDSNPTSMPEGFMVSEGHVRRPHKRFRDHEFGFFKGSHILIEWMYYSRGWENVSPEQRAIVMSLKAQGFNEKTKPAGMRTLGCIGVFENTGLSARYGFLHPLPIDNLDSDVDSSTATLLQLIENNKFQPLLGDKLRLASTLARFVEDFHNVGWLHENLRSNNVIFFDMKRSKGTSSRILATQALERPWGSEGPPDTRFDHVNSAISRYYRHPEYFGTERFRASYDHCGQGLILLELAFWRPLDVLWMKKQNSSTDLIDFKQELVDVWVPTLGASVGAVYRDVVHFCLSGTMDSIEDLDIRVLKEFAEKVVEPLKELAELNI